MYKFFIITCMLVTCNADTQMSERLKVLMGTFVSVRIDAAHKELLEPSFQIINAVDNSLSTYKQSSVIFQLNNKKHARLDKYSYEALASALVYYKKTDGYFNIAIGTITKDLYRFGSKERIVSMPELQRVPVNIETLKLKKHEAFLNNSTKVDLGGMGKGFAVDKVTQFLVKKKVKKAVVALSGDIRCIGSCKITVNNPLDERNPLAVFFMHNSGVSTSGNYNRYVKTTKYNHLIDPKTKQSGQEFISVTLVSKLPSATLDAYATAVSVMPIRKAYEFLESQNLAYIVLQADKKLIISENIDKYVDLIEKNTLKQ